jgi:hypothetical protein
MLTFLVTLTCALHTVCNFPTVTLMTKATSQKECEQKAYDVAGQYASQVHITCKVKK